MFSRHLKIVLLAALVISALGCRTSQQREEASNDRSSAQSPLASLAFDLPSFRTFDELKKFGEPHDETEKFYLFEGDTSKVVLIIPAWGADHWNVVLIYVFDDLRQQWIARGLLNPEVKRLHASFDKSSGTIDIKSGRGVLILRTNAGVWSPRSTRDW